ncbi:DUF3152 domain-containing protein [Streptomyces sp. NPDC026672]|uniref:DUF3152 domain-containing protein n=1 Tax=unclassified Streptomyces TaxID=2593676 RepID=UPI0033CC825D
MGRHSRRGPAPKGEAAGITSGRDAGTDAPGGATRGRGALPRREPLPREGLSGDTTGPAPGRSPFLPGQRTPLPDGTPAHGVPRVEGGTPGRGGFGFPDGTPARGVPRTPDDTPGRGIPRSADATPPAGARRFPDGTPARGVPTLGGGAAPGGGARFSDGTPARGVPLFGTPPHGIPRTGIGDRARGAHPEQREAGGGWGEWGGAGGSSRADAPRSRHGVAPTPRQEYLDAFDETARDLDVLAPRPGIGRQRVESYSPMPGAGAGTVHVGVGDDAPPTDPPAEAKGKSRAFTGIAAAAVTTVLAVIVAGQVARDHDDSDTQARSTAADQARDTHGYASRGDGRTPPSAPAAVPLTYEQKMDRKYPLAADLKGSGRFDAVPGFDKAPGKGRKYTYRVDVERGLGLDGELFAQTVQKTLNDPRSWAHGGALTFERVSSGEPDFVITLASPGTTADWCAKSGLDTTEDNVSCDSASTERVMINAYRWAQGSTTYGDEIHSYRQMLINHEVGHRLGHNHVTCDKDGALAPVMQQQTKFLDHDGIHCLPNPWPYPKS